MYEFWKFLSDLFDRSEVVPFQHLEALILTTPQKKNLRRAIKNKTDSYKFLNIQK